MQWVTHGRHYMAASSTLHKQGQEEPLAEASTAPSLARAETASPASPEATWSVQVFRRRNEGHLPQCWCCPYALALELQPRVTPKNPQNSGMKYKVMMV